MRHVVKPAAIALILLAALSYGAERLSDMDRFQLFGDLVADVKTDDKVIALTFDDGPTDAYTPLVLQTLADRGIKATFFVTGHEAEKHPDAMRAIIDADHEVGNHSWSHRRMVAITPATARDEINKTDKILRDLGYDAPLHFRPPYGRKLISLPWVLHQQGRLTVMWSVNAETFEPGQTAQEIADLTLAQTGPGDIILLHPMYRSRDAARQALPMIVDTLLDRGYQFVTVSDLLTRR